MSLFNEKYENIKAQKELENKHISNARNKLFSYICAIPICEDTYSDIITDNADIMRANQSLYPKEWSIPMEYFVNELKKYNDDSPDTTLIKTTAALYKIPIENIEERLTASLEYFKVMAIKGISIEYSEVPLKFLEQTIELYLKTNPPKQALAVFIEKIKFINQIIENSIRNNNEIPKIGNLIKIMNRLIYRFADYGYYQTKIERLGNFANENTVASIAPIVNNAGLVSTPDAKRELLLNPEVAIDNGVIPENMVEAYTDWIIDENAKIILEADNLYLEENFKNQVNKFANKAMNTASNVANNVSAVANKVDHTLKSAGRSAEAKWKRVKEILNKREHITAEALNDSPFLEQKLKSLAKAALGVGATIVTVGNFAGVIAAILMNEKYKRLKTEERNRIRVRLEEELSIVNEKIADYGSQGINEMKYALMRMKMKIEKTIRALEMDRPVKDFTDDKDLKGFRVDEKRILRNQRREEARLNRERDAIERSRNDYDD